MMGHQMDYSLADLMDLRLDHLLAYLLDSTLLLDYLLDLTLLLDYLWG